MKIRKMVIEDYEKVYQLWMSCAGMGLNNLDDSKEGIEKFLTKILSSYKFQFHKGTIRTDVSNSLTSDLSLFQFHKGTIRTQ